MSLAIPLTNGAMTAGAQVYVGEPTPPPAGGGSVAAVIVGLHYLGFRIGFDVGLGRG
jgi:hypothetical protein